MDPKQLSFDPSRFTLTPEQAEANDRRIAEWEQTQRERAYQRQVDRCRQQLRADLGSLWGVTLDQYTVHSERFREQQEHMLRRMRRLVEGIDEVVRKRLQIVWYGSVGAGKDHFAACALQAAAARGVFVRWVEGRPFYDRCAAAFANGSTQEAVYQEYSQPQVLCVSDPVWPDDFDSKWREYFNRLVRYRVHKHRPTWITCNVRDHDMAVKLFGSDVWSRLCHNAALLECRWEDYRRAKLRT